MLKSSRDKRATYRRTQDVRRRASNHPVKPGREGRKTVWNPVHGATEAPSPPIPLPGRHCPGFEALPLTNGHHPILIAL
jgi:hypothetical protein